MTMKFSLILPVYKVEKFLPDCLDSLLCQDIPEEEYEIVCVDDGSPDGSAEVVRSYREKHANITLLSQENGGVCAARNRGLAAAKGEYVWFIDPDDMIVSNCLKKIYELLKTTGADLFEMLRYRTCPEEQKFVPETVGFQIDGENDHGSSGSGWLSVCRREYLLKHGIIFNSQLHYGEDYLWALQTKYRRHKSIYTLTPLYLYRQRSGSAMNTNSREKTARRMEDMLTLERIYREEYRRCAEEGLPPDMLKNVLRRRELCTESALLCKMKLKPSPGEIGAFLDSLKKDGSYPYPLPTWKFGSHVIAGSLKFRLFTFLFPVRLYYFTVCLLYRVFAR